MQKAISLDFNIAPADTREAWLSSLAAAIDHMISTDFSRLVSILYRLDVNEQALKKLLRENPDTNAGVLIASQIEERQLQKLKTRQHYKQDRDIPDDEKW